MTAGPTLKFGRFQVLPRRREFLAEGTPVLLGSRAFDILMVLIEAGGELVTKDEILGRVWSGMVVEEHSLQFHISALRKVLGKDRAFIKTISGRGYRFVADITVADQEEEASVNATAALAPPSLSNPQHPTNLPAPTSDLIGREAEMREATALLTAHRLVTLVGSGGIGKTRLGLDVARRLRHSFADGVWVAELGLVSDPDLVPVTVATALKLEIAGGAVTPERVTAALGTKRLLLVLDNCEHVIDAAANMAEALLRANPAAHVMATSREPLRADGEWLYPVPPLAVPAEDAENADDLLRYGAVRLFIERTRAAEPHFMPDRHVAAMIATICRRLDGIPLAIELAAACSAVLGVEALAAHLGDSFQLLTSGRRTALPRHQTLRATLDWSYCLLAERERVLLRRLSVFAGAFSLEAASAVAADDEIAATDVLARLANLVAKSLVVVEVDGALARYRLLDTTRAYALDKLDESSERERLARRHAEYYRDLFEQADIEWERRSAAEWLNDYRRHIDNLRAALDWALAPGGDVSIGVALTAAATPLWMQLSLVAECRARVEHALAVFDAESSPDGPHGMKLYAALATSLAYIGGTPRELEAAWRKTLEFAERLDDPDYRLRAAWELWCLNRGSRWRHAAMTQARKFRALTANRADPNHHLTGERMLGVSYHYLGDQAKARRTLDGVLKGYINSKNRPHIDRFQVDLCVSARTFLAPVLWLLGFSDQAMRAAEAAIADAREANHEMSVGHALIFGACPTALLVGDLASGERYCDLLMDQATRRGLARWRAYAHSYQGALLIRRGDIAAGLQLLRASFDELGGFSALRYRDFLRPEALCAAGEIAEGLATVDEAIARTEETEEYVFMAELLRIRGELLLLPRAPQAAAEAEDLFRQAVDWAHRQGALCWELRAVTSLARLLRDQSRSGDAMALLQPVYGRFTEGFDTADLKAARLLLNDLRASPRNKAAIGTLAVSVCLAFANIPDLSSLFLA
jgi:predicted ATPase/DNA-binding winged helix-turn-helix (wHTH) protein